VGEDPDRIRREIEQTRAEMGETVDALGYKTDVKARAKDSIQDKKESVMGVASSAKERLVGAGTSAKDSVVGAGGSAKDSVVGAGQTVGDKTPDTEQVKQQAKRAVSVAQQNPLGLAIGAVAVGFLAGMLAPATRIEDEKLGQISDDVIDRAKETGQEALERGKQVAQEAAQSAQETVKDSGQQHAQELKGSAQDQAQQAASSARS
jgi:ElaB/YqjD/DUF883 family membrane-anchored ribosome-binding protein